MTDEQVEQEIQMEEMKQGGLFSVAFINRMNKNGIWFVFSKEGVRWSREPFI